MGLDKIKALLQISGDELRKMAASLVIWVKTPSDELKYLTYAGAVHYVSSYTYDFDAAEGLVRAAIETARTTPSSFKDALEAEVAQLEGVTGGYVDAGITAAEAIKNLAEAMAYLPTMEEAAETARRNMRAINEKARNKEVKTRGRNATNGRKKDFRRRRT